MVLACDADKPAETRPEIYARTLTLNQQKKLMTVLVKMQSAESPSEQIEHALDAAEICLTGWRHMINPDNGQAIEFNRDNIGEVLSLEELMEVFDSVTSAATTTSEDKKKSESQP